MRGVTRTEKFFPVFPDAARLWYLTALAGLFLFCFAASPTAESALPDGADVTPLPEEEAEAVFLMQGDRGEAVLQLQKDLLSLGYDVEANGVYSMNTASAVRRFQLDCGEVGDGVCTAEVAFAAAYLCRTASDAAVSEEAVRDALTAAGCLDPADGKQNVGEASQQLRNALILFQRTHGLCGTGEADYAVLCALGVISGSELLGAAYDMTGGHTAAESAVFDLRCRLLCDALSEFVSCYPRAYDLYTLTACAAVLCARTEDVRFPGGFDTVCRRGLLTDDMRVESSAADRAEMHGDPLLLLAAEDALTAFLAADGDDKSCGARYVLPAKEPLPQDACVCFRTRHFVFFR